MAKKFSGLNTLLSEDQEAREYFDSLPDYVQGSIADRNSHINSIESLRDYAENLLRGDD